jgi:hypothetical protein
MVYPALLPLMRTHVSPKEEILFLHVCHHISNAVYQALWEMNSSYYFHRYYYYYYYSHFSYFQKSPSSHSAKSVKVWYKNIPQRPQCAQPASNRKLYRNSKHEVESFKMPHWISMCMSLVHNIFLLTLPQWWEPVLRVSLTYYVRLVIILRMNILSLSSSWAGLAQSV